MKMVELSVVIIARNEEKMIGDCLKSVERMGELILLDGGSTDSTIKIAKNAGARVIQQKGNNFSAWRKQGIGIAKGDWLFYLDSDERVTQELKEEILNVTKDQGLKAKDQLVAYAIPRRNFYLGKEMHFGGAWPDYVKRLFRKDKLKSWRGRLHEEPIFEGELGHLAEPMIHLTHRDLSSMVEKTRKWSKIEAELLFEANHPSVIWWRILRIMLGEFWLRAVKLQGWRDGTVGWIEIIFQMFSRFVTYAQLWEMQKNKLLQPKVSSRSKVRPSLFSHPEGISGFKNEKSSNI